VAIFSTSSSVILPRLSPKLSRRQFLKLAGMAGALMLPAALGYQWLTRSAEPLSLRSPYAVASRTPATAPLLVVFNEQTDNPFAPYLEEILRAEGLGVFQTVRLAQLDASTLARFALVILSEGRLTTAQVEMLTAYVAQGGKLIAMRPAANLTELFGVTLAAGATENTYIQANTRNSRSDFILQFHGAATHYRVTEAQVIAWLTDEQGVPSAYPAITLHQWGKGQTALWAFDLARSIVYTRQGNPAWANQERDGRPGIRAVDAFVGWMDLDRLAIPHADEQMRLFSHIIAKMLDDTMPLPRLWYLPGGADGLLIATGDAHQAPAEAVEQVLRRVERYDGRMSVYYTPTAWGTWRRMAFKLGGESGLSWFGERSTDPLPSQVRAWRARGHEFGIHPFVEEGVQVGYHRAWQEFVAHGYAPVPPTVRTHRILWAGWVETARLQASLGLRMNVDYYHYGTAFQRAPNEWVYGYLNGSGLPMKFVDEQGQILDIYQQVTHLVDEHLMKMPWGGGWANLDGDLATRVAQDAINRVVHGAPAALAAQFHIDPFAAGDAWAIQAARFLEGTLAYAARQNLPIWTTEHWLHFTDVRHESTFDDLRWNDSAQRFSLQLVCRDEAALNLEVLLPMRFKNLHLAQIHVDGVPQTYRTRTIQDTEFAGVVVTAQRHHLEAIFG
jgi:hypothetical protein